MGQGADQYMGTTSANSAPFTDAQNTHSGQSPYVTPPPPFVGYEMPGQGAPYYGAYAPRRRRARGLFTLLTLLVLLAAGAGYAAYNNQLQPVMAAVTQKAGVVTDMLATRGILPPFANGAGAADGQAGTGLPNGGGELHGATTMTQTGEITATNGLTNGVSNGVAIQIAVPMDAHPTPKRLTAANSNDTSAQSTNTILEALATPTKDNALLGPQPAEPNNDAQVAGTKVPSAAVTLAPTATPTASATAMAALLASPTAAVPVVASEDDNSNDSKSGSSQSEDVNPAARFVTSTPEPDGRALSLVPLNGDAGWWKSNDSRRNNLNDSFLYSGFFEGETYFSVVRFDLSRIPRGAPIREATLALTGLSDEHLRPDVPAIWYLQLIAASDLESLVLANYDAAISAPPSMILFPELHTEDLAADRVNFWQLDAAARAWLENQLLSGADSLTVRIYASSAEAETLFAWDSGRGPESGGAPPELFLTLGPRPDVAPALPTEEFIVATLTPVPENVVTAVAQAATATTIAQTVGTFTPVPGRIFTPTPFPQNLATVQVVARNNGLPPVLLETPTPASPEEEQGRALYATAVAQTTGTFTPAPANYVTPVLILPSPPPENVATVAALVEMATAEAAAGLPTATPLPYNAVIAEYVIATALPENEATAAANAVILEAMVQTTGTPTPLPWNVVVLTPTPTPTPQQSPTSTPLPLIVPSGNFTPTPTPTPTFDVPDQLPEFFRNKILFISDRSGQDETYALDPNTGELFGITQPWVYPLARNQLAFSPDGRKEAIVSPDANRLRQIHIRSYEYNTTRQLTTFSGGERSMSYDPAWSPTGEWIAFVSANSGNDEIYRILPDGSVTEQLTHNEHVWDKHPSFSPDGQKIVFFSNRTGHNQLFIMNADGSDQHNISNNAYNDAYPVWTR